MHSIQVSYSKVTEQRGQKRLWLEGGRLERAGFAHGEAYITVLDVERRTLTLELHFMGDRQVAGRKKKGGETYTPILDLCNAEVAHMVGSCEKVKVSYYHGKVVISLHHEELQRELREARTKAAFAAGVVKTGTVCAGAGISTAAVHEGLKREGMIAECEWVVDVDGRYLEIADANNPVVTESTRLIVGTIEEVEAGELSPVDILNVSLPCDIHAACGKAKKRLAIAEEDSSITSVFGLVQVIKATMPSVIISENVVEARSSAAYLMIRAELERLGYRLSETVLNGHDAGSIESRERYWFVAVSKGLAHVALEDLVPEAKRFSVVAEVLDDTPETQSAFRYYDYLDIKEERDRAAGKGFRQQLVTVDAESVGCIGKGYQKVRSTEPRLSGLDGKSRLFTVDEHCRLKGIPEALLRDCLPTIGHEAAGQSVLWGHGVAIGALTALSMR